MARTARLGIAVTMLAAVLAAVQAAQSSGRTDMRGAGVVQKTTTRKAIHRLVKEAARLRRQTWQWQRLMGRPLTRQPRHLAAAGVIGARQQVHFWRRAKNKSHRLLMHPPPSLADWMCIHSHEGSWTDDGYPYWGGLQMNREFMAGYGAELVRKYGGTLVHRYDPLYGKVTLQAVGGEANHWTPMEQIWVAVRAWRVRGFNPWPQSAPTCGLY